MSCAKYPFLGDQSNTSTDRFLRRLCRSEAKWGLDRTAIRVPAKGSPIAAPHAAVPKTRCRSGSWPILRRMRSGKPRGLVVSLLLTCHPLPTLAMTLALTVAALLSGRTGVECLLVAVTILSGQLTVGWINDLVDRERDVRVGRTDKPLAMGWIDPHTVTLATAVAVLFVIPLSMANGTAAGIAHLLAVLSAWTYNL